MSNYEEVKEKVLRSKSNLVCVIGDRGSGKTKLAREIYSLDPVNNMLVIKNLRGRIGNIFSEVCYLRGIRVDTIIIDELDMHHRSVIDFDSIIKSCNKLVLTGTPLTLNCRVNFELSKTYLNDLKISPESIDMENMTFESLLLEVAFGKRVSKNPDVFHLKAN